MAIRAYFDQPVVGESQSGSARSSERRALRLETSGFVAGADADRAAVTIHNISAAGLLLETDQPLETGTEFAIDLPQAGLVTTKIVWRSERLYGCAFEQVIGAAALAAAQLQGFAPGVPTRPIASPPAGNLGDSLGNRLGRLRREAGLTLSDVAATLGVSKPTVWAWEKGKARPLPERLGAIAEALGVVPDALEPDRGAPSAVDEVIAACRQRIAEACGTDPQAVRIMVEL